MLYTGKGDKGTTKLFDSPAGARVSKSDIIFDALGTVDELNSFLGMCKVRAHTVGDFPKNRVAHDSAESLRAVSDEARSVIEARRKVQSQPIDLVSIVHNVQNNLFIIQAELAGAGKSIEEKSIEEIEKIINDIETSLPPITTFFVSGGTELAALFDTARAISRRAERLVIKVSEQNSTEISRTIQPETLQYLNRLSSLLYACARYANHVSGVGDSAPTY